jgi:DNA N6-methyl adenine demethylase
VRWCARCRDPRIRLENGMDVPLELPTWLDEAGRVHSFDPARQCAPDQPAFTGVRVYREALTPEEAERLLREIEAVPFIPSQSGKLKQHYGPRFNFTRRRMNADRFEGLPDYAHALESRLRDCVGGDEAGNPADLEACRTALTAYQTTDAFVLRYFEREESNLDFHVDDLFAYGEAIIDVSLDSDSVLTFLGPAGASASAENPVCVRVPLPARSIAVVHGRARFDWQHAILARDIRGVRTSITLRTLGGALRATDAGRQVLLRARPRSMP